MKNQVENIADSNDKEGSAFKISPPAGVYHKQFKNNKEM